jgi:hypothetical protein
LGVILLTLAKWPRLKEIIKKFHSRIVFMGMMLPCIKLNYHAYNPLVYPILFHSIFNHSSQFQEDNHQAFPCSL